MGAQMVYMPSAVTEKDFEDGGSFDLHGVQYGNCEMQGWRRSMEDSHLALPDMDDNIGLFAVFDGHGGRGVSRFASQRLAALLKDTTAYQEGDYERALEEAFLRVDEELRKPEGRQEVEKLDQPDKSKRQPQILVPRRMVQEFLRNRGGGSSPEAAHEGEEEEELVQEEERTSENEEEEKPVAEAKGAVEGQTNANSGAPDETTNGMKTEAKQDAKKEEDGVDAKDEVKHSAKEKDGEEKKEVKDGVEVSGNAKVEVPAEVDKNTEDQAKADETKAKAINGVSPDLKEDANQIADKETAAEEDDEEDLADEDYEEGDDDDDEEVIELPEGCLDDGDVDGGAWDDDDDESGCGDDGGEGMAAIDPSIICRESTPEAQGCTAVAVLLVRRTDGAGPRIICANAGDSRAILSRVGQVVALSEDHKPENPEETARIEKAGGFVQKMPGGARVQGDLNLSRAMGDLRYKKPPEMPPREQIVTAFPEVRTFQIKDEDEFMVIGCDGIWERCQNQEMVDFVRPRLVAAEAEGSPLSRIGAEICDRGLCPSMDMNKNKDFDGTGCDNMTVMVVQLKKHIDAGTTKRPAEGEAPEEPQTEKRPRTE